MAAAFRKAGQGMVHPGTPEYPHQAFQVCQWLGSPLWEVGGCCFWSRVRGSEQAADKNLIAPSIDRVSLQSPTVIEIFGARGLPCCLHTRRPPHGAWPECVCVPLAWPKVWASTYTRVTRVCQSALPVFLQRYRTHI